MAYSSPSWVKVDPMLSGECLDSSVFLEILRGFVLHIMIKSVHRLARVVNTFRSYRFEPLKEV